MRQGNYRHDSNNFNNNVADMKGEIDGAPYNRCPLCHEDMPENRLICDYDRKQIFDEMDKLKVSFGGHYEFDLTVTEWLEKEEHGEDINKPTD